MRPGLILFALPLGLAGAALAVPPQATPSAVGAKAVTPLSPSAPAAPLMQGKRSIALSPEGNAIAKQIIGAPDVRMGEINAEMKRIREQKLQLIGAPNVDLDKLEQFFRREETLQAEFVKRQNDRLLSLLRALSATDRAALLQNLANPLRMPAAGAPAPAAPGAVRPTIPATKPAKTN
jgi:uncharacterized membrane protein